MDGDHLLQVLQRNIAYSEQASAAGIALSHHRLPDLCVRIRPTVAGGRSVQHVAIDVVGAEMLERTSHRLRDLNGKIGRGIVGKTMILARTISELSLQKKIVAGGYACTIGGGQSLADSSFKIMPPLIRRVDAAKTRAESEFDEGRRAVLLPGSAIEKIRN